MIDPNCSLVGNVEFVAHVGEIITIGTRSDQGGRSHHRHSAARRTHRAHSHTTIRIGHVFLQEHLGNGANEVLRDHVAGERITDNLRVAGANRLGRIEAGIWMSAERVVNRCAAHAEVPARFHHRRDGINHRIGHGMAEAFKVCEKEGLLVADRAAERTAKIILHEMVAAHGVKCVCVHRAVSQKFIYGSV